MTRSSSMREHSGISRQASASRRSCSAPTIRSRSGTPTHVPESSRRFSPKTDATALFIRTPSAFSVFAEGVYLMTQALVTALRGIDIGVPDLALAEQFYTETWRLAVAARTSDAVYLRGTGEAHHILALHRSD